MHFKGKFEIIEREGETKRGERRREGERNKFLNMTELFQNRKLLCLVI